MSTKSNRNSQFFADSYEKFSQKLLKTLQASYPGIYSQPKSRLSKKILKASSQYVFEENTSLWKEDWFFEAYLSYFIHTQSARLFKVFYYNQKIFESVHSVVDFGCGPGTAQLVQSFLGNKPPKWTNIDHEDRALNTCKNLTADWGLNSAFLQQDKIPKATHKDTLLILSFALCEGMKTENIFTYDNVIILEPGQFKNSKELISLREKFLEKKYNILSPCTHSFSCPMKEGKKKWCHDTAAKPDFLNNYNVPFSDTRLNFSYLVVSKKSQIKTSKDCARVIGDLQIEKGKSKIAVCIDSETRFLTWLHKTKLKQDLNRGDLIAFSSDVKNKGQELRIDQSVQKYFPDSGGNSYG